MTKKSLSPSSEMPYVRSTFGCGCGEVIGGRAKSSTLLPGRSRRACDAVVGLESLDSGRELEDFEVVPTDDVAILLRLLLDTEDAEDIVTDD